jgi:hypothetical protein
LHVIIIILKKRPFEVSALLVNPFKQKIITDPSHAASRYNNNVLVGGAMSIHFGCFENKKTSVDHLYSKS